MVKFSAPITRTPENDILNDTSKDYIVRISFSSPEEDLHGTCMDPETTLKNFLAEANEGRMACYNHVKDCPMGITSNASQDNDGILYCDYSLDRDLPLNNPRVGFPNTEQIIRQIHNKRITKTSIGGVDGDLICNICDKSMISYGKNACWDHYPKEEFDIPDPKDPKKTISVKCTPKWVDLHLAEISAVWAGSNLQSEIFRMRAETMLEHGALTKSRAIRFNSLYDYKLDVSRAKPDTSTFFDMGGSDTMTDEERQKMEQLEAELAAEKAAKTKLEQEKAALEGDAKSLEREVSDLRKRCLDKYKVFRGANLTGQELLDYEETLGELSLHQLKTQDNILDGVQPEKEVGSKDDEESKEGVKPGRSTTDKDRSNNENGADEFAHPQGWALPSFFNKALEETGNSEEVNK